MPVIILLIADSFSDMNEASLEWSVWSAMVRSATYWIGVVSPIRYAEDGPSAMISDVAATVPVVANAITRLRKRERENKVILPPNRTNHCARGSPRLRSLAFPCLFWRFDSWRSAQPLETRAKKLPTTRTIGRDRPEHEARIRCSQLKTNLDIRIRI